MKKIDIKEIIVIGVVTFALCFAVSKFVLCKFGMQTDFLSASATFFAAVVAFYLYSDWKEPHNAQKILSERNELIHNLIQLRSDFYKFAVHVRLNIPHGNNSSEMSKYESDYLLLESNLVLCLDELRDKLYVYKNNFFENSNDGRLEFIPGTEAYLIQLESMYKIFMEHDPLEDFHKAYQNVKTHFDNGHFGHIMTSLTTNLRDYIIENK
ncbi:hypothetical protein [Acinetobacter sp. 1125_18A]|uniref:hypothetical protein n=1 Tax=Acinetobacter sp. 1125_18A TaxID=2605959 RepID=UPI0040582C15